MAFYPNTFSVCLREIPVLAHPRIIMLEKIQAQIPLCDRHKGHFRWRKILIWATLFVPFVLGIVALVIAIQRPGQWAGSGTLHSVAAGVFLGSGVFLGFWPTIAIFIIRRGIHVVRHDNFRVTFSGVSWEFIEAYHRWLEKSKVPSQTETSLPPGHATDPDDRIKPSS